MAEICPVCFRRVPDLSVMASAIGKRAGDPDGSDGIQPVGVLNDLTFDGLGPSAFVFAE